VRIPWTVLAALLALCVQSTGCVERRILIRSEPAGAPVWVDERPVGTTPLEYPFAHYGTRRVRAGPIYNELGTAEYLEQERMVRVEAPWYETFPVDFFFEVLWPTTLVDEHKVTLTLPAASTEEGLYGEERAKEIRKRGERFREKALGSAGE